jgi:hypothetical protein
LQLAPHTAANSQPFFFGADEGRRIFKVVMKLFRRAEKHGAAFAGVVADGDNVIEPLARKFIDVL